MSRPGSSHSQESLSKARDTSIQSKTPSPVRAPIGPPAGMPARTLSLGRRAGPGHQPPRINLQASIPIEPNARVRTDTWEALETVAEGDGLEAGSDEWFLTTDEVDDMRHGSNRDHIASQRSPRGELLARALGKRFASPNLLSAGTPLGSPYSSPGSTPPDSPALEARSKHLSTVLLYSLQNDSRLSLDLVVGTSKIIASKMWMLISQILMRCSTKFSSRALLSLTS